MRMIQVLAILTLSLAGPAGAADKDLPHPELHCGAYCLYVGIKALDLPVKDLEELETKLGQPSQLGYSIEQLSEAARGFGAKTLGVETSLENLRSRPNRFICIALLKQGHFVNLYDVTDERVYLIDPPNQRQVGLDGFRAIWTGKALLISDQPIPDESSLGRRFSWLLLALAALTPLAVAGVMFFTILRKRGLAAASILLSIGTMPGCGDTDAHAFKVPSIQVTPSKIDLGEVMISRDRDVTVPVHIVNRGTDDLRVFSVQASCGCTIVQAPPSRIEPGRDYAVGVTVRTGVQAGPRESVLTIQSSDPVTPLVRLPITWNTVSGLSSDPGELNLGTLRPGQSVERRISVKATPEIDIHDVQAQTSAPGFVFEWQRSEDMSNDRGPRGTLIVRFTAGSMQGDSAALIMLAGKSTNAVTTIPTRWRVASRVSVHPSALFSAGVEPRSKVTSRLALQSEEGEVFGIRSVTINSERCSFILVGGGNRSGTQHVQVEAIAPDVRGSHRLFLEISTDLPDAKPILVPWSMTVH